MEFDEDGNLLFRVESEEGDFNFDEIGSVKDKGIQRTRKSSFKRWRHTTRYFPK